MTFRGKALYALSNYYGLAGRLRESPPSRALRALSARFGEAKEGKMGMSLEDALAVQRTPEHLRARAKKGEKVYLGKETRPGWTGYLPFYLFQCPHPDCRMLVKDYPHGFTERQYLTCPECGERVDFVMFWAGLREFFSTIIFIFRLRFSRRQESGRQ